MVHARYAGWMKAPIRRPPSQSEAGVATADPPSHRRATARALRATVNEVLELLRERGFSRQQAYVICSVAVDLRVSNVVDVPNYVVSALLPEAIFDSA